MQAPGSHRLRRPAPHRAASALLLALLPLAAAGAQPGGGEPKGLVVGVDYVAPEYRGGEKFRSPPTIDNALAADLGKRLDLPVEVVGSDAQVAPGQAVLRIATLAGVSAVPPAVAAVPVGYRAAPMAIMRTDTTIRRWDQLQGREVCVAIGGRHVGTVGPRYGAVEQVHPSVTDALIALRTGGCDALVHDSTMLEELIRFPEWKKFSARLPVGPRSTLAVLVPVQDRRMVSRVQRVAAAWIAEGFPDAVVSNAVRNMAFEVYLEQDVPDCH